MAAEAAEVIQMEDQIIVKEFGIQKLAAANVALMKKQILEIPETPENKEQYDQVYRYHVDLKKLLPRIEERRKELKAPVLKKSREIDDTAKRAVGMIQPLIELAEPRRSAWEKIKADEKAEKEKAEAERVAKIDQLLSDLNHYIDEGKAYNVGSDHIKNCIHELEKLEISSVDFQEKTEEAELIKKTGLETLNTVLENRLKFEEEQTRLAEEKAKAEAEAKRLEEERAKIEAEKAAEAKRIAEKEAKLEAERKAKAEAEAEKRRQEEEKLRKERKALEAEKAKLEAEKQARIEKQRAIDQFNRDHAEAIEAHELYKAQIEDEIDSLMADAKARWEATEKAREEAAARAKLVEPDKALIKELATGLYDFIAETHGVPVNFKTKEAEVLYLDMQASLRRVVQAFENAGEELV